MKHQIFTVYDSKAHAYLTPFFLHEDDMAIRVFSDCVNDATHQFGKHPEDYTLFKIGSWEDDKAKFFTNNPIALGNGIEFVSAKYEENYNPDQDLLFTDPKVGDLKEVN